MMLRSILVSCILVGLQAKSNVADFPSALLAGDLAGDKQLDGASRTSESSDAADSSAVSYSSFLHVFGEDRLQAHFDTEDDFHHSVRRASSFVSAGPSVASAEDLVHNSLACGLYSHGRALKLHLEAQEGVQSVSTVFTSQSDNRACFTITASAATLEGIDFSTTPLV
jgi:hypothetical protein